MTATAVTAARPLREAIRRNLGRQAGTFAIIGVASTLAYAVLYAALRGLMSAQAANALALLVTAIGNTTANRRLTFGVRGRHALVGDQLAGLAALGVALVITTAAVSLLGLVAPGAGRAVELVVLVGANAAATVARFVLLRWWIGGSARGRSAVSSPAGAGPAGAEPA
jgi:putative flippase GtrA